MSISIQDLAVHRGIQPDKPGGSTFNAGEYMRVGLPFMGGCEVCSANLAPYNAYPSKSGMIRCLDDLGALGYETVEEANEDIFGDQDNDELNLAVGRLKRELNAREVE